MTGDLETKMLGSSLRMGAAAQQTGASCFALQAMQHKKTTGSESALHCGDEAFDLAALCWEEGNKRHNGKQFDACLKSSASITKCKNQG